MSPITDIAITNTINNDNDNHTDDNDNHRTTNQNANHSMNNYYYP